MGRLVFTQFANCKSTSSDIKTLSWEKWCEKLAKRDTRKNKDGPCLVLGESNGRGKSAVTEVYAVGLDIDGTDSDVITNAVKALSKFEFFLYTTHSHGIKGPRVRIVVPLAAPVPPETHPTLWRDLNQRLGGLVDPSTKDVSRLHYLPSTPPESAEGHFHIHNKGKFYDVDDAADCVAGPPQQASEPAPAPRDELDELQIIDLTDEVRNKLRHARTSEWKPAFKRLLEGAPIADKGHRHPSIVGITWFISSKFPQLPAEVVERLFAPSVASMLEQDSDAPDMEDVFKAFEGAKQKRSDELWSIQRRGQPAYSDEELEMLAETQDSTVEGLRNRWVIQKNDNFYILSGTGFYVGPYTMIEARAAALQILARSPVPMSINGPNGPRRRQIQEVVETHGAVASKIVADIGIQGSTFDGSSGIFTEAVCPRRNIEPTFDKKIDAWLKILAGDQYDKLQDWMACCPDTNRLLCALYFAGNAGAGKTLLAHSLARIWTTGAITEIDSVLSEFNEELSLCPMVIGDEALPKTWRGNSVTTKLRSMISITHRTLKRKHRPPADLRGAIRLILTANNEFLLQSEGASSQQDLEAIAQRFLYIECTEDATKYIEALPQSTRDKWLTGDGIAKHALWLMENRPVESKGRFAVQGEATTMHRLLLTGTAWNSMVCEWLVRYLMNPKPIDQKSDGLIRRDGRLLVNDQAIIDGWEMYLKTHKDPDTSKIGQALRTISLNDRPQLRWQGRRIRYRVVDLQHLIAWTERNTIGDAELIMALGERTETDNTTDDLDSIPTANSAEVPL